MYIVLARNLDNVFVCCFLSYLSHGAGLPAASEAQALARHPQAPRTARLEDSASGWLAGPSLLACLDPALCAANDLLQGLFRSFARGMPYLGTSRKRFPSSQPFNHSATHHCLPPDLPAGCGLPQVR